MRSGHTEAAAEPVAWRMGGGDRRAWQPGELVGASRRPRDSRPGELGVFRRRIDPRDRIGRDRSSRRRAEGARARQAHSPRTAFLRRAHRGLRNRALHGQRGDRADHAGVDPVAPVLDLFRRRVPDRGRAEPGDEDPGAPRGRPARRDVLPVRRADARAGVGAGAGQSVHSGNRPSRDRLQRRRPGAGGKSHRPAARADGASPEDRGAILHRRSRALLRLRAVHARRRRARRAPRPPHARLRLRARRVDVPARPRSTPSPEPCCSPARGPAPRRRGSACACS